MTFSNANNTTYNLQATYRGGAFVKSDVSTWIKQQWATMVRRALDQKLLMRQFAMMITFPDGKKGDRVTIPTLGRLGVNVKAAGVPVTLQKNTPGNWQILVDQYKETSFMVEDIVDIFLDPNGLLLNNLAKEAAYAISRDLDASLLALRAATQNLGGAQVIYNTSDYANTGTSISKPFTLQSFLKAKLALDNADVPQEGRVLVVSPTQYIQLLAIDKVQSMFYRTSAPLESAIVGTLMGVPVYMTSMVTTNSATGFNNGSTTTATPGVSTSIYYPTQDTSASLPVAWTNAQAGDQAKVQTAVMFSKEAFAMALMQEPKSEHSRETLYLSDAMVTSTLYGSRLYRPECAVLIHTNAEVPTT